jgi:hypothetical protein
VEQLICWTKRVCWGSGSTRRDRTNPTSKLDHFPEPTQPPFYFALVSFTEKKEGNRFSFGFYLRFLRMIAAAAAIMMITTIPMAMYVAVGAALDGGMTTGLGVGATVLVGTMVGVAVFA